MVKTTISNLAAMIGFTYFWAVFPNDYLLGVYPEASLSVASIPWFYVIYLILYFSLCGLICTFSQKIKSRIGKPSILLHLGSGFIASAGCFMMWLVEVTPTVALIWIIGGAVTWMVGSLILFCRWFHHLCNTSSVSLLQVSAISFTLYIACDFVAPMASSMMLQVALAGLPLLSAVCLVVLTKNESAETEELAETVITNAREAALCEAAAKYHLSQRERDVLDQWSQGRSRKDAGKKLFISPNTVASHVGVIYRKTGCGNRDELIEMMHQLEADLAKSA